jgi:hypothetical protein
MNKWALNVRIMLPTGQAINELYGPFDSAAKARNYQPNFMLSKEIYREPMMLFDPCLCCARNCGQQQNEQQGAKNA